MLNKYSSILLEQFSKRKFIEPFYFEVFQNPDLRSSEYIRTETTFDIDQLLNYHFVSDEIKQYLKTHPQIQYKVNNNIYVSLTQNKVPDIDYSKICKIKNFINDIFNTNINPDIYLILQPMKKKITQPNYYTPHNINSGMTDQYKIVVFRYEEWEKVLIHELIHCVYGRQTFDITPNLRDMYKINGEIKTNEAFIESQALIIYCLYVKQMYNKDIFMDEIQFSLFQCYKIGRQFSQTTSVFSYYIVKTALLLNHNYYDFLKNNHKTKEEFKILVDESLHDPIFINITTGNDMEHSIIEQSDINNFLYQTLRMTMHTYL